MEFNRNQYFFLGVLVLLIGLQIRAISSFELNADATRIIAERTPAASGDGPFSLASAQQVVPALGRRVVRPPEWLGWCLISVGSVLVLHSLAMKKPD